MSQCRECSAEIPPTGKRGRPPVLCPGCRGSRTESHQRISPAQSGISTGTKRDGARVSSHTFQGEGRHCLMCGRAVWVHIDKGEDR